MHITQSKSALKILTGFVVIGGALYGLTLSPAFSQTTPPPAPPDSPDGGPARRPRAPRDGGPRGSGLRPIQGPFQVDRSGRLIERPDAGGLDGRGPEGHGKRGKKHKHPRRGPGNPQGPRDDRGPQDGPPPPPDGPRDGGPPAPPDGGPRGGGPKAGPAGTMERAYRGAFELDRYGQLQGDVLSLTGQARSYYTRAGAALESGNEEQALPLAHISERLTQAALHLQRAQSGPLPPPQVAGWVAPPLPAPRAPQDEQEPRVLFDLNARLQSPGDADEGAASSTWNQTARRLAVQARLDSGAKRFEASRERAQAAMTLLDAARLQSSTS